MELCESVESGWPGKWPSLFTLRVTACLSIPVPSAAVGAGTHATGCGSARVACSSHNPALVSPSQELSVLIVSAVERLQGCEEFSALLHGVLQASSSGTLNTYRTDSTHHQGAQQANSFKGCDRGRCRQALFLVILWSLSVCSTTKIPAGRRVCCMRSCKDWSNGHKRR